MKGKKRRGFEHTTGVVIHKKGTNLSLRNDMLTREAKRPGFYVEKCYKCFSIQFSPRSVEKVVHRFVTLSGVRSVF